MAKEWIAQQFPINDPEAFIEALERSILGEFGPADAADGATLDDLIEHAKLTPIFRGCLLDACEREFSLPWPECDRPEGREHKILVGLLALVSRIPLDGAWDTISDWFYRHAHMLEESDQGLALGVMALGVLKIVDPGLSPETCQWWLRYATSEAWALTVANLFPDPPKTQSS